jgi:hypothetical protein
MKRLILVVSALALFFSVALVIYNDHTTWLELSQVEQKEVRLLQNMLDEAQVNDIVFLGNGESSDGCVVVGRGLSLLTVRCGKPRSTETTVRPVKFRHTSELLALVEQGAYVVRQSSPQYQGILATISIL